MPLVEICQFIQRAIEIQQIDDVQRRSRHILDAGYIHPFHAAAALLPLADARKVNQNAAH